MRKSGTAHLTNLLSMKEITFRVPDCMVQLLEEWAKHIPEMEIVSLHEPKEYGLDEMNSRMALAIKVLEQKKVIRHIYDYTWIMAAIGDGAVEGMDPFKSPQSFIDYLKMLHAEHVPCRSTLSNWYGRVLGKYPNWEFIDTKDPQEIIRRKNVVKELVNTLNNTEKEPS